MTGFYLVKAEGVIIIRHWSGIERVGGCSKLNLVNPYLDKYDSRRNVCLWRTCVMPVTVNLF